MFNRAEHCKRIASKGGQTTVTRYGRAHMSQIGRHGWESTTRKYFRNEQDHKQWLAASGLYQYWRSTHLPMKYDQWGNPIWPDKKPIHPAHEGYTEF